MKRLTGYISAFMLLGFIWAAPALGQSAFEFVGTSAATTTGDVGIFALNNLCSDTFSGARMCTSGEILGTVEPPTLPAALAWARPTIASMDVESSGSEVIDRDSGVKSFVIGGRLSCGSWNDASPGIAGLMVGTDDGAFGLAACSSAISVACCAPVAVMGGGIPNCMGSNCGGGGPTLTTCGNGSCEIGEDEISCPADCDVK